MRWYKAHGPNIERWNPFSVHVDFQCSLISGIRIQANIRARTHTLSPAFILVRHKSSISCWNDAKHHYTNYYCCCFHFAWDFTMFIGKNCVQMHFHVLTDAWKHSAQWKRQNAMCIVFGWPKPLYRLRTEKGISVCWVLWATNIK